MLMRLLLKPVVAVDGDDDETDLCIVVDDGDG
jgi:hypothetical protein